MPDLELTSAAFDDGEPIPRKHTCDGEDASPALAWSSVPEGTLTLALIMHDPDAPSGDFVHWVAWNIDAGPGELPEGGSAPVEGANGFGRPGYGGPCPPPGHGTHRYFFHLFAADTDLDLAPGSASDQLRDALDGHVLGEARLMGTYERA